jgi:hypothetical protein
VAADPAVAFLDRSTGILHLCGDAHLVTRCGLGPDWPGEVTVGPYRALYRLSFASCPSCQPHPSAGLPW